VSKKNSHYTFVHNFDKCWSIVHNSFTERNLQENLCYIFHHTLDVLVHCLAKLKIENLSISCYSFYKPT